jgi:uridine kinase
MVIGITGGTGSGKTTVVREIMRQFPMKDVVLLSQDNYYFDNSHLTAEEKKSMNFDHPNSIEFSLLEDHVQMLKKGVAIRQPSYSYITCTRTEGQSVESQKVVIVEGILILNSARLRDLFDVKVYVDAPSDERLIRVIRRDILERGRDMEEVLRRYEETIRPMHDQFIEPTKQFADIIIPHGGYNRVAIRVVGDMINNKLKESSGESMG